MSFSKFGMICTDTYKAKKIRFIGHQIVNGKKKKISEHCLDDEGFLSARGKETFVHTIPERFDRVGNCSSVLAITNFRKDKLEDLKGYLVNLPERDFSILFNLLQLNKSQIDVARIMSGEDRGKDKLNKSRVYECKNKHLNSMLSIIN